MGTLYKIKSIGNQNINDYLIKKGIRLYESNKVSFLYKNVFDNFDSKQLKISFSINNYNNTNRNVVKLECTLNDKKEIIDITYKLCTCHDFFKNKICEHIAASIHSIDNKYFKKDKVRIVASDDEIPLEEKVSNILNRYYYFYDEDNFIDELINQDIDVYNLSTDDFVTIIKLCSSTTRISGEYINSLVINLIKRNDYNDDSLDQLIKKLSELEKGLNFYNNLKYHSNLDIKERLIISLSKLLTNDTHTNAIIKNNSLTSSIIFDVFDIVDDDIKIDLISAISNNYYHLDKNQKYKIYNLFNKLYTKLNEDNINENNQIVNKLNHFYNHNFSIMTDFNINNVKYLKTEDLLFLKFLLNDQNDKKIFDNAINHITYFLLFFVDLKTFFATLELYPKGIELIKTNEEPILNLFDKSKVINLNVSFIYGILGITDKMPLFGTHLTYFLMGNVLTNDDKDILLSIFDTIKNALTKKYLLEEEKDVIYFLLHFKYEKLLEKMKKMKNKLNNEVYKMYQEYIFSNSEYSLDGYKEVKVDDN